MMDDETISKWRVETDYPVAVESLDHLHPCGTMRDDSRSAAFNAALVGLVVDQHRAAGCRHNARLMDIGCAGGGMVNDFVDMGWDAVGIEGSDYSRKAGRASWGIIPDCLFTADATKGFDVYLHGEPVRFDVITAWEFFEHIELENGDLSGVMLNVATHLLPGGCLICSVANYPFEHDGVELHRTVRSFDWWEGFFAGFGFLRDKEAEARFAPDKWVRWGEGSACFVLRLREGC